MYLLFKDPCATSQIVLRGSTTLLRKCHFFSFKKHHQTIEVCSSNLQSFKQKREGEKGKDEGSGTGRQKPCAYIELDKGFIGTNCSILEQSLGHSFLVTAGVPGTLNNYICFFRSHFPRGAFFRDCHSLCSCLLSPHLGANTCPWLPSGADDTENPKRF